MGGVVRRRWEEVAGGKSRFEELGGGGLRN